MNLFKDALVQLPLYPNISIFYSILTIRNVTNSSATLIDCKVVKKSVSAQEAVFLTLEISSELNCKRPISGSYFLPVKTPFTSFSSKYGKSFTKESSSRGE